MEGRPHFQLGVMQNCLETKPYRHTCTHGGYPQRGLTKMERPPHPAPDVDSTTHGLGSWTE